MKKTILFLVTILMFTILSCNKKIDKSNLNVKYRVEWYIDPNKPIEYFVQDGINGVSYNEMKSIKTIESRVYQTTKNRDDSVKIIYDNYSILESLQGKDFDSTIRYMKHNVDSAIIVYKKADSISQTLNQQYNNL
jgi:hypothetical protein